MASRGLLAVAALLLVAAGVYIAQLRAELATLRRAAAGAGAPRGTAEAAREALAPPAGTAATPSAPRALSAEQRRTIVEILQGETDAARTVWFQVDDRNAEAAAFQKQLAAAFREAGWRVEERDSAGLTFKPGVYLLVGEEDWPHYASTAYEALERAGLEVKAARGYRAYYEEQKRERPGWQGPKLDPDQTYVVLIGANPS
jgi:hypothetical protein